MLKEVHVVIAAVVVAQVYIVLLEPRYILDWVGPYIERIKSKRIQKLLTCSTCMAGQIALWSYPFFCQYNPLIHIQVVIAAIWVAHVSNKIVL